MSLRRPEKTTKDLLLAREVIINHVVIFAIDPAVLKLVPLHFGAVAKIPTKTGHVSEQTLPELKGKISKDSSLSPDADQFGQGTAHHEDRTVPKAQNETDKKIGNSETKKLKIMKI
jgi:hypothetical protein